MEQKDYRLAAILYTDIAGFSRMMENDEAGTLRLLHFHNAVITEAAERRHGTVIKTIGDAFLVDFRNTVEALQTALEIQDKFYQYNLEHRDLPLLVRIGIHLGDIYFFENDALGEGINIAARLQSLAHPGAICMSQDVYNQVLNKIDFHAVKLGKVSLKNITKEIHAYEISSANVEFDPNRDKPRPGFPTGAYAGEESAELVTPGPSVPDPRLRSSREARTSGKPGAGPAKAPGPDRDYSPEGSANVLAEIRRAILDDTKTEGRRLTVDEALKRYGDYGVEAHEVIARMAEQGLLIKRTPSRIDAAGRFDGESLGRDIERAVRGIVALVDDKIGEYEESRRRDRDSARDGGRDGSRDGGRDGARDRHREDGRDRSERGMDRMEARLERFAERMERGAGRWSEKSAIKAELRMHAETTETGEWDKELKDSDYFRPGREELATSFEAYREGLSEKVRRLRGGFAGNLVSFLGVNALLWFINLQVHAGPPFLWAAIVTAGWGTGLVSNLAGLFRANSKLREADRVPDLEGEALSTYKKLNIVRDSMAKHTVSVLTVPALLFTIYTVVTPMIFPWWLIPSGIMAISWVSHAIAYASTRRRLERKLFQETGVAGWRDLFRIGKTRKAAAKASGPYASLYAEAEAAKEAIIAQIKAAGKDSPFDKEFIPSLEEYVGQVRLLTQTVNEIDSIIDAIPMKDLAKDKANLKVKMDGTPSPSLKTEYARSVEEIEKQEKSFQDLQDQREVLHLRLKSSVNSLKQMQLDMARYRANPDLAQTASLDQVRSRTGELSKYLEDLRKGYEEAREAEDPWKDLERQAAEREARAKALPKAETASGTSEGSGERPPPADPGE
ncbi:MAG: adenylate/guanylate cyclase domain-containing protein [Treponema sp.]|nr:adenylate/guanylate cyclase domain-containing protein [Treponema sp.]